MKNKKARATLLTIGMLLLALAVLSGSRPLPKELFSTQTSGSVDTENSNELEQIADETAPLAAPAVSAPQTVQLVAQQEPVAEEPVTVEPVTEELAPVDPAPVDPAPVDPAPVDPAPVDPAPVDPAPVDPAPVDPAPVDPAPVDPAPVDPAPVDPAPVDPAPVDPAPVDPAPVDPAPVDPAPVDPAPVDPAPVDPAPVDPAPVTLSAAQKLLERSYALLAQYNACTTMEQKRVLLGASNYSLGNDALRTKLLADMGGSWDQLEEEVTDATEYQQGKTLYVQVYMSGSSSDYTPVVYTTPNSDRNNNQWATNLVYVEDEATWMEYVKKHQYNNSRVAYYVTELAKAGTWDTLQETMETSDLWQEVPVTEETPSGDPAPLTETAPTLG